MSVTTDPTTGPGSGPADQPAGDGPVTEIDALRLEIDALDAEILRLVKRRSGGTRRTGA